LQMSASRTRALLVIRTSEGVKIKSCNVETNGNEAADGRQTEGEWKGNDRDYSQEYPIFQCAFQIQAPKGKHSECRGFRNAPFFTGDKREKGPSWLHESCDNRIDAFGQLIGRYFTQEPHPPSEPPYLP
ncbi:hypothetical protein KUCAC02_026645, partial [Chaenocephalus aceratus]